nr:Tn3 family transposase [Ensifer sp. ENS12]
MAGRLASATTDQTRYSQLWGDGTTASSDGQFFRASDRAARSRRSDINPHYGREQGSKFYFANIGKD